jgi:putative transposase
MVHVDSTKFDIRCSPDLLAKLGFDCPTIYIAMDSATGRPLGRAVLFGSACRNALAVLIRDIYARQGFLPRYWIVDQGAEYMGHWFSEFCTVFGATRIQPPAGNPRKNSLAENALGRINAENAHSLRGSTAPDQKGRSVTARQKSRATARHNYQTVVGLLDEYIFGDMPETISGANTLSPSEKEDLLKSTFGRVGVARVEHKDDLLIATSIPIDRDVKIDPRRGIRHLERTYASTPLLAAMRTLKPRERPRKDCINPRRMYVRFESGWILATSADELSACGRPDVENLFDLLSDKTVRSENAEGRAASRRKRALRIEQANAEANNTQMELVNDECGGEKARASKSDRWTPRSEEVLPFDSVYEQ